MATGLETLDALMCATRDLPAGSVFKINRIDAIDLCKLSVEDLKARGFSEEIARETAAYMLKTARVDQIGDLLGIRLLVEKGVRDLIPGEGLRRAAGALADDPRTLQDILKEVDEIRHPGRAAS